MIQGKACYWRPWQLAFDETVYGPDAGKFICVTLDGEHDARDFEPTSSLARALEYCNTAPEPDHV